MKLGEHTVTLTALCADGTVLTTDYSVNCQEITDPLQKYYIYGVSKLTITRMDSTRLMADM